MSSATPASLGYRMPAEWEEHRATWIAWPHNRADWEGKMATIHWDYVEIVRALSMSERVSILTRDAAQERRARGMLEKTGVDLARLRFHRIPTNRAWLRDSGPVFLVREAKSRRRIITDWRFNAWAKYRNWRLDDRVPRGVARASRVDRIEPSHENGRGPRRVVFEGGSIDVNGRGLLLTTEECLLSDRQVRNPGFTRADWERIFGDYFDIKKVLWLGRGILGDDTHGHVDDIARFVGPRSVLAAYEDDPADENHEPLRDNWRRLRRMRDLRGRALEVARVPMPRPLFFEGDRLPASYLNFYIANRAVLVPTFSDPADRIALNTIQKAFPKRDVIGVPSVNLVVGQGSIHCLTQQEPA